MNPPVLLSVVFLCVASLCCTRESKDGSSMQGPLDPHLLPPTSVNQDPTEVFQRAFWKRPDEGDEILHAQRLEWSDSSGTSKWQWFLVVKPSQALQHYLRDENAFGLIPGGITPAMDRVPSWFEVEESDQLYSPDGGMYLWFSKLGNRLYATGSGKGFRSGMPEMETQLEPGPVSSGGRLPTTRPPAVRGRAYSER